MKKSFLKSLTAVSALVCATSASAGFINIGGINMPTGGHFEVASIYENVVTGVGQELKGVGEVTSINGFATNTLCAGCELTYRFEGYIVTSITPTSITFSGGTIRFYLGFGADNDFNPFTSGGSAADIAAAGNGTLFLTLAGHAIDAAGNTFAGSGNNIGSPNAAGNGAGLADVVAGGGIATNFFDTDSITALFGPAFADFQIGSSFSNVLLSPAQRAECNANPFAPLCLAGSADMRGLVIPEPGSLTLAGLALLGLGSIARRRRS
mgnify:FL=1